MVSQQAEPLVERLAGQETLVEKAELGASREDDPGALNAQALGVLGAFSQELEQIGNRQVGGERRQLDVEAGIGRVGGGNLEPAQIATRDPHSSAV